MADGCTRYKDQGFGGNVQRRNVECLRRTCGWVRARAHSRASEISATISSYLGSLNDEFDATMGDFAPAHADQAERDHAVLTAAARKGRITSARNPRRRDHMDCASSVRMSK
jgi:hypothetical protein